MIPFSRPTYTGNEDGYVLEAMRSKNMSADGEFNRRCQQWFERTMDCPRAFLTPSCTHALEMTAIAINIQPGDEIIMPSYTFVSTANAFVLRGAKIVFVDIRPDTMNIDETLVEAAITDKTKAIVPVHYAAIACEMDTIGDIAKSHRLLVIEDAAHGLLASYKGQQLGTIGDIGTHSFHGTKNFTSGGEGGLLILNDSQYIDRAEIIRQRGTNRSAFLAGKSDQYSWKDKGSSYLLSDIQAAYLWGQLEWKERIHEDRMTTWRHYEKGLGPLAGLGHVELPVVPVGCEHNGHMFFLKAKDLEERTALLTHLRQKGVDAVFHYIPLHTSEAGMRFSRFHGEDRFTTKESERLLRLPLWYGISAEDVQHVIDCVSDFYR